MATSFFRESLISPRKPPVSRQGLRGWLHENLFSGPVNSLVTLLVGALAIYALVPVIEWALIKAQWVGDSRADCSGDGACWVYIETRLGSLIYGFYPEAQRWRVDIVFVLFVVLGIWLMVPAVPGKKVAALVGLLVFPVVAFFLLSGGFGLEHVPTRCWGGLMLTLVIASVGIVGSLPLGIVLALGRRSSMPLVRGVCVVFIEFWRGVPLITVLFMASVMFPLFVPEDFNIDKLLRALVGIMLFWSAYMAEVVRSGLQAIPSGQGEAGAALGLGYWQRMGLVVLPQALKLVIPGIVNTFIALFKDTTLVLIIGLFDFLALIKAGTSDSSWLGFAIEGFVFAALVYWIFCFGMSRYSQFIERRLYRGH
ncbi:amino acid ABC transporter permease [Larsenimonas rhizosphaerae]|uniref:Amino acid ABC transporter permease n=1 Tax=Larsenimonas rhizosphaerae TaxID=2944682 RepID=A0AA41ZGL0_9GAMM|nr:amino acid ABC transporter permease [Larsenimonas rhizosphaerae]MCX2524155.1 amino acid ABC transporter permease [Larsenimonas rhizosphaerae]